MTLVVSRGAIYLSDGQKACSRCRRRPPKPGQRYCAPCFADYAWERRQGKIQVLLTPEEWAAVKAAREAAPAGRHHAR